MSRPTRARQWAVHTRLLLFGAIWSTLCTTALANADSLDLHVPFIGAPAPAINVTQPLHRFMHAQDAQTGRKRALLVTTTDAGVLAAVEPRNGSVAWRQRYSADRPIAHDACSPARLVVSHGLARVDSVDAYYGRTIWTHQAHSQSGRVNVFCWAERNNHDVIIATDKVVQRLSGQSGEVHWTMTLPQSDDVPTLLRASDKTLEIVSTSGGQAAQVHVVDVNSGVADESSVHLFATPSASPDTTVTLQQASSSTPLRVWISKGKVYYQRASESKAKQWKDTESDSPVVSFKDIGVMERGVILAQRADNTRVALVVDLENAVQMLWDFPDTNAKSMFSAFSDRSGGVHIAHLSYSEFLELATLQVVDWESELNEDGGILSGHTFGYAEEVDGEYNAFALEVAPMEKGFATRIFVGSEGGSMQAWEGEHLVWRRDEGLASADKVLWIDQRPASEMPVSKLIRTPVDSVKEFLSGLRSHVPPKRQTLARLVAASSRHHTVYIADATHNFTVVHRVRVPGDAGSIRFQSLSLKEDDANLVNVIVGKIDGPTRVFTLELSSGQWQHSTAQDVLTVQPAAGPPHVLSGRVGQALNWQQSLSTSDKIVANASCQLDAIASPGRVLGDRSTLRKLLDVHNVALLVAHSVTSTGSLVILDAKDGSTLASISGIEGLTESSRPSMTFVDNWVLVSYHAAQDNAQLTRVVSVELFLKDGRVLSGLRIYRVSIKSVTTTTLGIASKAALFTNALGQVIAVPQRLLNPRRPFGKPTKHDAEEMLIPYERILKLNEQWIAFSKIDTLETNTIITKPGHRESESLVVVLGLDLIVGRVTPSAKPFDELSPDFNKAQLVGMLSVLSIGLVYVRSAVQREQNRRKWYSAAQQ
ncbi:hypothetical protein OIV83_004803 [Microbotryomycetes sp. JL201]|nr:hypothetical protein OIV83_004803 [Microbotryomycetes sp. JL201]